MQRSATSHDMQGAKIHATKTPEFMLPCPFNYAILHSIVHETSRCYGNAMSCMVCHPHACHAPWLLTKQQDGQLLHAGVLAVQQVLSDLITLL